jgi:hypothetical protein
MLRRLAGIALLVGLLSACSNEEASPPSSEDASVYVLLADNRLLKVSAADGEVLQWKLGPPPRSTAAGRLLALGEEGRTLFALVPGGEGASDSVVAVDTASLRIRARYALERRSRFAALLLGPRSGRLYVLGNRQGGPIPELRDLGDVREATVVATVLDPTSGKALVASALRAAKGHDWRIYTAAISPDERRLLVSYHGTSTTGVDWIEITGKRLERCRREPVFPGAGCVGDVHGAVEPYRDGLLGATGSHSIVEVGRGGGVVRKLETRLRRTHLMELALDSDHARLYAVGSCYQGAGLSRLDLRTGRARVLARPEAGAHLYGKLPKVCGDRIAIAGGSLLAIAKTSSASPSPRGPGTLLLVDGRSGRLIRSVETPTEPVDLIAAGRE